MSEYRYGQRVRLAPSYVAALKAAKLYNAAEDEAIGEISGSIGSNVYRVRFRAPRALFLRLVHARNLAPA